MSVGRQLAIRRADADDLDAVARVWRASAMTMDGAPVVPSLSALRARIDEELAGGWALFVAVRGAEVVGMAALKPAIQTLDQLFIAPGEQRCGTGEKLLCMAQALMPDGFTLRMAAGNGRARAFYRKSGLVLIGTGKHPRHGYPVESYGWKASTNSPGSAVTG